MPYFVYIVKCIDNSLYTGITTNISRRIHEHNFTKKGAKYTKTRRPVTLVYSEEYRSRSDASKREYQIKKLSKIEKEMIIKDEM